ncbi:Neuroligin 4-like [Orchesella cincta]|uniref:Neuroligin 4-like n=1 Tax=Orchesella cincta TaxID=48709 RepID=A0A1D2M4J4_ORCCI|nr:Neuroligin 4-like [Orchesella cincta]
MSQSRGSALPLFAHVMSSTGEIQSKNSENSVWGPPWYHLLPGRGLLGVPYASAPSASLRFMPPLTPTRWSGVRVAEKLGPVCPQILPDIANRSEALSKMPLLKFTRFLELSKILTNQSEDCLYLNIFLPRKGNYSKVTGSHIPFNLIN